MERPVRLAFGSRRGHTVRIGLCGRRNHFTEATEFNTTSTIVHYYLDYNSTGRQIPYQKKIPEPSHAITLGVLKNYFGAEFKYFVEEWFSHKNVESLREITDDEEIIKPVREEDEVLVYLETPKYCKDLSKLQGKMSLDVEALIEMIDGTESVNSETRLPLSERDWDVYSRVDQSQRSWDLYLRVEHLKKIIATVKAHTEAVSKAKPNYCLDTPPSRKYAFLVELLEKRMEKIRDEALQSKFYPELLIQLDEQEEEINKFKAQMKDINEKWRNVFEIPENSTTHSVEDALISQVAQQKEEIATLKADNASLKKKVEAIENLTWMLKPADDLNACVSERAAEKPQIE